MSKQFEGDGKVMAPSIKFLLRFRWIAMLLVTLPMCFVSRLYWAFRDFIYYTFMQDSAGHEHRVTEIQRQVRRYAESGGNAKLCTARSNWKTMSLRYPTYKSSNAVKIELYDILELNLETETVRVEPLCTIGRLTKLLFPKGWTLPVVPELDDLTVGGLVNGYGIETSSHVHGLFFDNVTACELVLGDGSLVTATPHNEHAELFHAIAWSHGSLGFLVSVDLKIIRVKPYVHVSYQPLHGLDAIVQAVNDASCSPNPHQFVECLMFSRDTAVLMTGDYADLPSNSNSNANVNAINRWHKPLFFRYVESLLTRNVARSEYIPTRDYYHRHTRALFWELEMMIPFANTALFRWALGWTLPLSVPIIKATQGRKLANYFKDFHMAQDVLVPCNYLKQTIQYCHDQFAIYPVWLCPHQTKRTDPSGFLKPHDPNARDYEMYMDVGIYGTPACVLRNEPFYTRAQTHALGEFLRKIGGYQALYAITEMTKDEFEQMFDHTLLYRMRKKYNANLFYMPYEKISSK